MKRRDTHRPWPRALLGAAMVLAVVASGACSVDRPDPIACNVEPYLLSIGGLPPPPTGVRRMAPRLSEYERAVVDALQRAMERPPTELERAVTVAPKTLALSGGGPWGAYGAGFMKAWKDRLDGFPRFATVTGVSTGALLATFAFLGARQLDRLDRLYREVGNDDIYAARNPVFAVLRRNAFNSLEPLRRLIREQILENGLIAEVEGEARLGRKLFVGLVDLDSGELLAADLTRVASDGELSPAEKETCYTELLLASAAVPVAFDPVATESRAPARKRLLVDGGVRAAAFVESSERALDELAARRRLMGREFEGETVVVVNGTLAMCPQNTEGGILTIGKRSLATLIKQNNLDSLANILARRAGNGSCTRYTYVSFSDDLCSVEVDTTTFDPVFMNDLADRGRERWRTGPPFESVGACEILPQ